MTARTRGGRPRMVNGPRRAPAVRGVVLVQLPDFHGSVYLPRPTMQYGGVLPLPPGTVLRIDIGDARACHDWPIETLAGALRECVEIEVIGTDPYGVAETRAALCRALSAGVSPAC